MNTSYRSWPASLMLAFVVTAMGPAQAQMARSFPQNALRGQMVFGAPPEVVLNGQPTRLAPGHQIRNQNNLLMLSGEMAADTKLVVNYTLDLQGQPKLVWLLRPEEIAVQPWPTKLEQTQTWRFNPLAQTWAKP